MKIDFEIKRLTEKYTADVAKIENKCFSRPWNETAISAELENEFSRFYIAVCGGSAVGYVGIYVLTGEADIVRVAVLPEFRENGIARAVRLIAMFFLMFAKVMLPQLHFINRLGFMTRVCVKIIIQCQRKMPF